MNAKRKQYLTETYGAASKEKLLQAYQENESFLANPGNAKPEEIEAAKETSQFLKELVAALESSPVEEIEAPTAPKKNDREAAIVGRMAASGGSLNRAQAEIAVDHQIENDKQKAAEAKAAAAKK